MKINIIHHEVLNGHQGAIYSIFSGAAEDFFYSAGGDGWVVKWLDQKMAEGTLVARDEDSILSAIKLGNIILAGTLQGNLIEIPLSENKSTKKWKAHQRGTYAVCAFSAGIFYTGGANGELSRWELDPSRKTNSHLISAYKIRHIAVLENRTEILALDSGGKIYKLDCESLEIIDSAQVASTANFCLISVDGKIYVGGMDAQIRILEAATLKTDQVIPAHWFAVYDLKKHPFLPILASASRDKTIRLWELPDMKLLLTIREHHHSVNSLLWSKDGKMLISAGDDRMVRCFTLDFE